MALDYTNLFRNIGVLLRTVNLYYESAQEDSNAPASATISGATQANPGVITATAHGFKSGDRVFIVGVGGMTELNGKVWIVDVINANTFRIYATDADRLPDDPQDTSGYTAFASNGYAVKVGVFDLEELLDWAYGTISVGLNPEILTDGLGTLFNSVKDTQVGTINVVAGQIDRILNDPVLVREELIGLSQSAGFEEVLEELIADMIAESETVLRSTVTLGSVTANAGNSGNGTVLVDKVLDGFSAPHPGWAANLDYEDLDSEISRSETMTLTCTQDEDSDGIPQGEEVFVWEGQQIQVDAFDWRTEGSGTNVSVPSLASYSIIANGNFEAFDSNVPESWDLDSGVAGTNVVQEGTGADVYRGSYALRFDGDGATATIKISQTLPANSLTPGRRYCLAAMVKGTAATGAGTLTIQFESPSGEYTAGGTEQIVMNAAALSAQTTYGLEYFYFTIPAKVPADMELVIKVTGTLTNAKSVWVDSLCFGPVLYGNGVNVVVIPGSDQFTRRDRFSFTVTNNYLGKFQTFFGKRYRVQLPSSATPTVKDAWAG